LFGIIVAYPVLLGVIFLFGLLTGGFSNVTSGGAGILTIYIMTNFGSMVIQKATGTVLAASTLIVLVGTISFYRKKQVHTQLGITVGLSGVAGAFLAARWASSIQSSTLEQVFGAFCLVLAFYTSFRFYSEWKAAKRTTQELSSMRPSIAGGSNGGGAKNPAPPKASAGPGINSAPSRWAGTNPSALAVQVGKGILVGVATGLFGVALASLSIVLFILLFRLETKMILGTSLFASFFRYLGGAAGYLSAGLVDPIFFTVLAIGGVIGSIVGARIVLGTGRGSKEIYIKIIVVGILLFIAYSFFLKFYLPIGSMLHLFEEGIQASLACQSSCLAL
jgi:uncharacterized membrane protein YfcA